MKFTVAKKGYATNEVDSYVAEADAKLEEYRKMEAAISNSIISAEIAKDRIITEAEQKAKKIIENANIEVAEQVDAIKKMLECEKKALEEFCFEYDAVLKTYFTAGAAEVTAPLKEKLHMMEAIINEQENADNDNDNNDPFGEIKNYF